MSRTLIIHPILQYEDKTLRSDEAKLEEIASLSLAIALEVVEKTFIPLRQVRPSTYIGKGKLEEIAGFIKSNDIELMVFDGVLTAVQHRNLEEELSCKVIDRIALILEIFGERATTKEGILQVELAALEYQKSRLVRSWTHLERQRGGMGFVGGPGETQIESDRRVINDRVAKIRKQLEIVTKTRKLHRKSRQKVPYPIVALVGYTNSGKSTLFNRVTGAKVMAQDLLFATLDPTMRQVILPSGRKIILSDTVGFISDLPTQLVASFRATLEEVIEANLILHIRDISCPDTIAQNEDVINVLKELGLSEKMDSSLIEVLNKVDLLENTKKHPDKIYISALDGTGCDDLLQNLDEYFAKTTQKFNVTLPVSEGKLIAWLYNKGHDIVSKTEDKLIHLELLLDQSDIDRFNKMHEKLQK